MNSDTLPWSIQNSYDTIGDLGMQDGYQEGTYILYKQNSSRLWLKLCILIDSCEVYGQTGLTAGMVSDKSDPRVTVQEPVLKMRLGIQNPSFHHNIKLQEHSQLEVKGLDLAQLQKL